MASSLKEKLTEKDIAIIARIALSLNAEIIAREGSVQAMCQPCAVELSKRLRKAGYKAYPVKGSFTLDNPDPEQYDEEAFETGEAFTPDHYWVEIGDLVVDPTAQQFSYEVDEGIPSVIIGYYDDLDRHERERIIG